MYPTAPAYRAKPPSQGTAETLALVAWIFQVLVSLFYISIGFFALVGGGFLFAVVGVGTGFALLGLIAIVVPILMLYVGFVYGYRRIRDGNFAGAKAPTLVLAILGLLFGALIVGILYLIAYIKVGDAEIEGRNWGYPPAQAPYGYGYSPAGPYSATPWTATGPAPGMPAGGVAYQPPPAAAIAPRVCPRCQRPATYIPQYGRSYCYACAQYV